MTITTKSSLLLAITLTLTGCSTYPLGVSKAEWDTMSPEKQEEYRKLQAIAESQKRQDNDADRRYIEQSIRNAEAAATR